MLYHLIGLKDIADKRVNIDVIWHVHDPVDLRNFLSNKGVIVVSLEEISDTQTETAMYVTVGTNQQHFQCHGDRETLHAAALFWEQLDIPVLDVNSVKHPADAASVQQIINAARSQARLAKKSYQTQQIEEKQEYSQQYADKDLQKAQKLSDHTLFRIQEASAKYNNYISPTQRKKLDEYEQTLRRLRLGNNVSKLKEVIDDVMHMLDDIEINYLQHSDKHVLFAQTSVLNIDLEDAVDTYTRVYHGKQLGIIHGLREHLYARFGMRAIYIDFLRKDLVHGLADGKRITQLLQLYNHALIISCIIVIVLMSWLLQLYTTRGPEIIHRAGQLITLGSLGLALVVCSYIHKRYKIHILLLLLGYIVLYIGIHWFILHLFALG